MTGAEIAMVVAVVTGPTAAVLIALNQEKRRVQRDDGWTSSYFDANTNGKCKVVP